MVSDLGQGTELCCHCQQMGEGFRCVIEDQNDYLLFFFSPYFLGQLSDESPHIGNILH